MKVIVSSRNLVNYHAKEFAPTAIISIVDPEDTFPAFNNDVPIFGAKFDDLCFEPMSDIDIARYHPPTIDLVLDILKFGEDHLDDDSRLLVHCFAGISRSSAAAIIALTPLLGIDSAVEKIAGLNVRHSETLYESGQSWFMPNDLMVKYADKILQKNGELVQLVKSSFKY